MSKRKGKTIQEPGKKLPDPSSEIDGLKKQLEIEAALERVRARAITMEHSDQLREVIQEVFLQLNRLGLSPQMCCIDILEKGSKDFNLWIATATEDYPQKIVIPYFDHPIFNEYHQAIKNRRSLFTGNYSRSIKNSFYNYAFLHSDLRMASKKRKDFLAKSKAYSTSVAITRHLTLGLVNYDGRVSSKEDNEILLRFAKVFDQSYTRFLDLQKAEEQAREAQIEAALERVRARTMAMQQSEELSDVATVLFQQVKALGVPQWSCGFNIWKTGDKEFTFYAGSPDGEILAPCKVPLTEHPVFRAFDESRARGDELYIYEKEGEFQAGHYKYMLSVPGGLGNMLQGFLNAGLSFPTFQIDHVANFAYGNLIFITYEHFPEMHNVFKRFAKVFEQTYARFLDLQKAEKQAREAQIEAALERVRSKSMAMYKTEELWEVIRVVFKQFTLLDITLDSCYIDIFKEGDKDIHMWIAAGTEMYPEQVHLPYIKHPVFEQSLEARTNGEKFYVLDIDRKSKDRLFDHFYKNAKNIKIPAKRRKFILQGTGLSASVTVLPHASITIFNYRGIIYSEEENEILQRIGKVFEQTYTRFLDLQKAEEQAREAQIEAALERVRSAAMAMHSSDDLFSVAGVLHDQLGELGQKELESSIIHIYPENLPTFDAWYSYRSADDESRQIMDRGLIPWNACSWTRKVKTHYQSKEKSYMIESRRKMLFDWYRALETIAPAVLDYDKKGKIIVPKVLYYHFSKFSGGALLMVSNESPTEEARDLQQRAAVVFDLAYRRFLDLKKAEAQTREAQIEAALERVRASTMAMHSSEDVGQATMVLFQELENLGIETLRCGILIIDENQTMQVWAASAFTGDMVFNVSGVVDMTIHPLLEQLFEDWKSRKNTFTYELEGKDAERYYRAVQKLPDYELPEVKNLPARHVCTGFLFKEGALFAFTKDSFTEEISAIFQKFTNVFTLTYRRYLDLIEAEARTAEVILKSSLDRVRGEIASMRNTDDLQRITPLVWRELQSLGVPFFRCGVFIMDEEAETVHMYLSTPAGEPLAALQLDFDDEEIPLVKDAIEHWKTQTVHRTHWDRQQFKTFTQSLKKRGLIDSLRTYQQGEKPPKSLNLHQVPFKQGMLYVGSSEPLPDDQIELIQSLADAFSVAYSRYEDFVKLEEAKESVENTLTELQSAQDQLIHSEKMASLGELTAGIAHEIQNPLNFVNNFSEVSTELLDEMKEEIESGNTEEVVELVENLIQNLDKIAHHGKRASGIVKGMLDHSRTSSGEKTPTDINVLADEYLRLAYHGLRAKDKSFNATMETDFDESIGKVEVISQDIGRVILNLITNAFHAVSSKASLRKEDSAMEDAEFKPTVSVQTKNLENSILISVKDNGNGIPNAIKDKIFQPFFTTKATGEGTGLGLSMSYDIITKGHSGQLEVESEEGSGATFKILLPKT